jgi:hypothetical protein
MSFCHEGEFIYIYNLQISPKAFGMKEREERGGAGACTTRR